MSHKVICNRGGQSDEVVRPVRARKEDGVRARDVQSRYAAYVITVPVEKPILDLGQQGILLRLIRIEDQSK